MSVPSNMNLKEKPPAFSAPIRLRGHHLLCLYGFRGLGYSEEFIANMTALLEGIQRGPERLVELVEEADDICRACPHLRNSGCAKKGEESEARVREHDGRILRRLRLAKGRILPAGEAFRLLARSTAPDDLPELCQRCEWLALGYCQEGLREHRMPEAKTRRSST
jgi:hypothetical protein